MDLLRFYLSFPIHDHSGDPLSEDDVTAAHYERVTQLQRLFFKHVPKLRELALANCGTGEARPPAGARGWATLVGAAACRGPGRCTLAGRAAFAPSPAPHTCGTPPPAVAKREVLKRELAALTPEELRFLITRQLR